MKTGKILPLLFVKLSLLIVFTNAKVFSGEEGTGGDDYRMTVRGKMIGGRLFNAPDADVDIVGGLHGTEVIEIPRGMDMAAHVNKYAVIKLPKDDELENNYMSF